jgi:energy-coupling factor transport system ATP-binding protein
MEDAARLASRIIVMNRGKVACDGTPAEVFSRYDMLHGIGLAVPQINRLMSLLNQRDPRIPADIFNVRDAAEILYEYFRTAGEGFPIPS